MTGTHASARINYKVVAVLAIVIIVLGVGAFVARHVRRKMISSNALSEGRTALARQDWPEACKHLRRYLGYHPDDVEMLTQYAEAHLATEPLELRNIAAGVGAYRRLLTLTRDDAAVFEKLADLYFHVRDFNELAYVAGRRLERAPDDVKAPLWLARSLVFQRKYEKARQTLLPLVDRLAKAEKKHPEYVEACWFLSRIAELESTEPGEAKAEALAFLNRAVSYDPTSPEAFLHRATFYRTAAPPDGEVRNRMLAAARADLERVAALAPRDLRLRLLLCNEWMEHGKLDLAQGQLAALEKLDKAEVKDQFLDLNDWVAAKYLQHAELALRQGDVAHAVELTDQTLAALTQRRHRRRALPAAVRLYLMGDKAGQARRCLDEYLEAVAVAQGPPVERAELARLQSMVARSEGNHYAVIEIIEPVIVQARTDPMLWRFLAEAYSRTGQTRRAIRALSEHLRLRPRDWDMTLQLAREYVRRRDWRRAYEAARRAETVRPGDVVARLLRIETSIYVAADRPEAAAGAWLKKLAEELAVMQETHPKRADVRVLQAAVARVTGRVDEAVAGLKQAVQECDSPLRAELELARLHFSLKRLPEAVEACREACRRHPQSAEAWLTLAELQRAAGQAPEARSALSDALKTVTDRWEKRGLALKLATLEITDGDRQPGMDRLKQLADADERDVRARSLLLALPEVLADEAQAQTLIDEIRRTQGQTGLLWRLHQARLWLIGPGWRAKQQAIASALERCVEGDPEWSVPVLLLSQMHERLGNLAEAEAVCRRAFTADPSAADVADRLVRLLEKQARFPEAKQVLDKLEASPRGLSARRIRLAIGAGQFNRAIDDLKLRVASDVSDADSRVLLARLLYWQTKDAAAALRYLDEAERILGPGTMTVTAVKAGIMRAEGRVAEARRILDDHVQKTQSFGAYLLRAGFLAATGEPALAERDYLKLTTLAKTGRGHEVLAGFYLKSNRLSDAVAVLDKGATVHPDDLSVRKTLMQTLLLRGQEADRQRAAKILDDLERRVPDDPGVLRVRAALLLREASDASVRKAEEILERAVQLKPTAADAHLMLIGIARRRGEYAAARDRAIRGLGPNPRDVRLLLARAEAERGLNNPKMAVSLAQMALKQDPDSVEARNMLAEAALASGDRAALEEALTVTAEAIKADPKDEAPRLSHALILNALGRRGQAVDDLEAFRRDQGGKPSLAVLLTLAELYRVDGDFDKAGQRIDEASRLFPNSTAVVRERLIWLGTQKRFDEAKTLAQEYRAKHPKDVAVSLTAAGVLASAGDQPNLAEAMKLYEHVARAAPTLLDARLGLAAAAYQTGDADRAERICREVLAQDGDNVRALNDLAWILTEHRRDHEAALKMASKGLALAPNSPHLLDTRGVILSRLPDRLDDARRDFERLLDVTAPDSAPRAKALLQLGRACAKLGDSVRAKQCLEQALEIDRKRPAFTAQERTEIKKILGGLGPQT